MNALLVSRYHPLLVMLHWLIAVLIVALLGVGFFLTVAMPNSDPQKIGVLLIHMSAGMFVFALTAVRFIVLLSTARPAGEPLPPDFAIYPTFVAHFYFAWLLLGLLVLHVIAALYYQFFLRDGSFRRMWFGRRASRLSACAE